MRKKRLLCINHPDYGPVLQQLKRTTAVIKESLAEEVTSERLNEVSLVDIRRKSTLGAGRANKAVSVHLGNTGFPCHAEHEKAWKVWTLNSRS